MNLLISLFCLIIIQPNLVEKQIIAEYEGGMPYTVWANLKINKNGKYEYHVSTHQNVYTKDKGNWELKDGKLILNSSKKIKKRSRDKKVGKAKLLFKNFKFIINGDKLEYSKKNKFTFKETYFHLMKVNEEL